MMAEKNKNNKVKSIHDVINKLDKLTITNTRIGAVFPSPSKDNQIWSLANPDTKKASRPPRGKKEKSVSGDGDGKEKTKRRMSGKKNDGGRKDYGKVVTVFKCGNDACASSWTSLHGWTQLTPLVCHGCQSKAKVVKMIEDMLLVVEYRCDCGESWAMPHEDAYPGPSQLDCDCGLKATAGGPQLRFGRQYWIRCLRDKCGEEWEEVNLESEYSQKCKKCFSSGNKIGTKTENGGSGGRRGGFPHWMRGGSHNVEFCDMCQLLRSQGHAYSCVPKKRVLIEQVVVDGVKTDRVVGTLDMKKKDVPTKS